MNETVAFIGDVHGALGPLSEVAERALREASTIVFLGDYVNRGAESRQVLDYLVDLQDRVGERAHFLVGHHDSAFLAAIESGSTDRFLRMGGAATLSSYPPASAEHGSRRLLDRIPPSHISFLQNLEPAFAGRGCVGAHDARDVAPLDGETYGVFGHQLLVSRTPNIDDSRALIDTGCGTWQDGKLTCFLFPTMTWFQST